MVARSAVLHGDRGPTNGDHPIGRKSEFFDGFQISSPTVVAASVAFSAAPDEANLPVAPRVEPQHERADGRGIRKSDHMFNRLSRTVPDFDHGDTGRCEPAAGQRGMLSAGHDYPFWAALERQLDQLLLGPCLIIRISE